jgi:hypothetical protein
MACSMLLPLVAVCEYCVQQHPVFLSCGIFDVHNVSDMADWLLY